MDPFLSTVEPFKHLPAEEHVVFRERCCAKGEILFHEGQKADSVWVVKTGRVHLKRFSSSGKTSTPCVMTPGEMFCCLPALDQGPYPADAVAAEKSTVIVIPAEQFKQMLSRHPAFREKAICLLCHRLRQVEEKGCMLYESAEQRLARVLMALSKKFGPTIPLTREELSEIAGITPETTIRVMSLFKKQGMIRSSRGKTTLIKPALLDALCPQRIEDYWDQ